MGQSRLDVILGAILGTIALALSAPSASTAAAEAVTEATIEAVLRSSLASACDSQAPGFKRMAAEINENTAGLHHQPIRNGSDIAGWSRSFLVRELGIIEITRLAPGGTLATLQIDLQVSDGTHVLPIYSLLAGGDCEIVEGRRLYYRDDGQVDRLELLDRELVPTGAVTELNPAFLPADESENNHNAIRVAVVDSGVNYQLPHIAAVIARDGANKPLGYDYWDLDDFPFDSDTRRSPFYPLRRGTKAAGVLTLETPGSFLIPYRFPYPDVRRMVDLVADADRAGARIMLISFEGRGRGDWKPFKRRAANNETMLFVISAGIGGRDLDRDPARSTSQRHSSSPARQARARSSRVRTGVRTQLMSPWSPRRSPPWVSTVMCGLPAVPASRPRESRPWPRGLSRSIPVGASNVFAQTSWRGHDIPKLSRAKPAMGLSRRPRCSRPPPIPASFIGIARSICSCRPHVWRAR